MKNELLKEYNEQISSLLSEKEAYYFYSVYDVYSVTVGGYDSSGNECCECCCCLILLSACFGG